MPVLRVELMRLEEGLVFLDLGCSRLIQQRIAVGHFLAEGAEDPVGRLRVLDDGPGLLFFL